MEKGNTAWNILGILVCLALGMYSPLAWVGMIVIAVFATWADTDY